MLKISPQTGSYEVPEFFAALAKLVDLFEY
jgi:hypothetical protein